MGDQRVQFVVAVSRKEKPFIQICKDFSISRPTGYLWWKRYQAEGISGLQEKSRKPYNSPGKTSPEIEEKIVQLRTHRPDWGARKLQHILSKQGVWLPATTIHRVCLRRGLVHEADRHPAAVQRFQRAAPNQLWQMDFKGPKGWDQPVGPLAVLDDHSRYLTTLVGGMTTRGDLVKAALEQTFMQCGVPEEMLMDHGSPWWIQQGVHGWTFLAVWLMKQDVRLRFSGYRHPQTQGKVEHLNRSLTHALLRRGTPADGQRQAWLDEFRYEHNHVRPHEALQMKTPSQVWQKSSRPYQPQPPEWKYPEGYGLAQVQRNGWSKIDRRRYWVSAALAGETIGWVEAEGRILVHYRKTLVCELNPDNGKTTLAR